MPRQWIWSPLRITQASPPSGVLPAENTPLPPGSRAVTLPPEPLDDSDRLATDVPLLL